MSKTGIRYFVTFVDVFSCVTWIYFKKNHSELFSHFTALCAEIMTQLNQSAHTLRSDNAKETYSTFSNVIWFRMVLCISHHVLTHHLKMMWLKGKIDTFLRLPGHSCFKYEFLNLFGMLFLQYAFSLIACFHCSWSHSIWFSFPY